MSSKQDPAIGIDLGTTFSCVAMLDDLGRPQTLINAEGDKITPSAVFFEGDNLVVGKEDGRSGCWRLRGWRTPVLHGAESICWKPSPRQSQRQERRHRPPTRYRGAQPLAAASPMIQPLVLPSPGGLAAPTTDARNGDGANQSR